MEYEYSDKEIKFKKELSDLDKFVKNFIEIVEKNKLNYVIVSGYISIVFGRNRNTEDVDMIVENIPFNIFKSFWKDLSDDFECINTDDPEEAYKYLEDDIAIRFNKKGKFIPNIEFKFNKSNIDNFSLKNKIRIKINGFEFKTSLLELQIVFKLYLGSEKDIEDAKFLYELFAKYLNKEILYELLDDFGKETKQRMKFLENDKNK